MSDELFHEELIAMHLHEQEYRAEQAHGAYPGHPNWFGLKAEVRRKYRQRAKLMIQEAREPRG